MLITIRNLTPNSLSTSVGVVLPHATVEFDVTDVQYSKCVDELLALEQGKLLELTVADERIPKYALFNGTGTLDAPLTLYVETTGDDKNLGTKDKPFKTVQAAVDSLPREIRNKVMVQCGIGNFAGVYIDGFKTRLSVDIETTYSGLEVRGTLIPFTPTTGTNSGTLTSYSASSGSTLAIATDNTQSWTVDDLKGKFLVGLSGTGFPGTESVPPIHPIVSNTATTITFLGPAMASGATYQIQDCGTTIDNNVTPLSPSGNLGGVSSSRRGITVSGCSGGAIGISRLRIVSSATLTSWTSGMNMKILACQLIAQAGANSGVIWSGTASDSAGTCNITQCVIQSLNNMTAVSLNCSNTQASNTIYYCFFEALSPTSSTGIGLGGGGKIFVANCVLSNYYSSISFTRSHTNSLNVSGSRIDGGGVGSYGILMDGTLTSNLPPAGGAITVVACDISNCTVAAINMVSPLTFGWMPAATVTGSGNAIGFELAQGAKIKVHSGVTLTGSIEVQIDGATTDLTTMRGNSPKVIRDPNYGTMIYE